MDSPHIYSFKIQHENILNIYPKPTHFFMSMYFCIITFRIYKKGLGFFRYGEVCIRKFGIHIFPFEHTQTTRRIYIAYYNSRIPIYNHNSMEFRIRLCGSKTKYMKIGICTPWVHIQFLFPSTKWNLYIYTYNFFLIFFPTHGIVCYSYIFFIFFFI